MSCFNFTNKCVKPLQGLVKSLCFLFMMLCLPTLASTSASFSYTEFNIAFILGISLPVLLFAVLMRKLVSIKWQYLAAITLAIFVFFFGQVLEHSFQLQMSLSAASVYVALVCLWPLASERDDSLALGVVCQRESLVTWFMHGIKVLLAIFLIALWFMELAVTNAAFSFGLYAGAVLLISFTQAVSLKNVAEKDYTVFSRLMIQFILHSAFALALGLYINGISSYYWVVIALLLSYVVTLANGCWLLMQNILLLLKGAQSNETLSSEELFHYSLDPATNLPMAQQALQIFEDKLAKDHNKRYAVVIFNPVNFQQVNNVLGHRNSDILLSQLAYCLQQQASGNQDLLRFGYNPEAIRMARLQGLNFLVVFDLANTEHEAHYAINELCQDLADSVPSAMSFKSFSLNFKLAFGVSISGEDGSNVNDLISYAEDALLTSMNKQRMISYFDSESLLYTQQQLSRMELLKADIHDENLFWYLQPQININEAEIYGLQLKVHWYENENQPLELEEFILVAEHSGDVYLLTKQMLSQAFKVLYSLHQKGYYYTVSVTLTSDSLLEVDLVEYIETLMERFHILGKYLVIELAEEAILEATDRAKAIIGQLRALEISIAISGFSGSYESLRYLRKMAVQQVKINCQALAESDDNRVDKAIINSLVNLSRTMKLPLIGTDLSDAVALDAYKRMGGSIAQGEEVYTGIVPDELTIWLKKWNELNPKKR